jgi:hypothetical protein
MTGPDFPDIPFDALSLEPLDAPSRADVAAASGRARFSIDLRSGKDRRQRAERRQELRFQADRRSGADRRPRKSWEPGSNL